MNSENNNEKKEIIKNVLATTQFHQIHSFIQVLSIRSHIVTGVYMYYSCSIHVNM
jgi:hypothetical protein